MKARQLLQTHWAKQGIVLLLPSLIGGSGGFLGVVGCKKADTQAAAAPSSTDPSTSFTDPGTVSERSMYVRVNANSNYDYAIHETESVAATSTTCEIKSSDLPATHASPTPWTTARTAVEKLCVIEAPELDLHFFGLELNFNFPSSMCTYVRYNAPWYYFSEVGQGPSAISYDLVDGAQVLPVAVTPYSGGGPAVTGGLTAANVPYCNFDYTSVGGPNCCLGKADITVRTLTTNPAPSPTTTSTAASEHDWGGTATACIGGAALDTDPKDARGFPIPTLKFTENVGSNGLLKFPSLNERGFSNTIYLANYAASHASPTPAPSPLWRPMRLNTGDALVAAKLGGNNGLGTPNRYYEFQCLDRGKEIKARIRVLVREWNDYGAYLNRSTSSPDTTTPAENYYNDANQAYPINDYADWKDFIAFPGNN